MKKERLQIQVFNQIGRKVFESEGLISKKENFMLKVDSAKMKLKKGKYWMKMVLGNEIHAFKINHKGNS